MGWRDRMKKNSAYSAEIAYRDEKIKKEGNSNKIRSKPSFHTYTHITHITQNTQSKANEEISESTPILRQHISETDNYHVAHLPEPTAPKKTTSYLEHHKLPEIADIYNQANGNSAISPDLCDRSSIEIQQNKMPEKNNHESELIGIENGTISHSDETKTQNVSASIKDVQLSLNYIEGQKTITKKDCPARCKRTGKCHGTACFDAKPGPAKVCMPKLCQWADRFAKNER
jgi:hypothetical protein